MSEVVVEELVRLQRDHGWTLNIPVGDTQLHWVADRRDAESSLYSEQQLDSLAAGSDGWWYRTRNRIIHDALSACRISGALWDVGSGVGAVAVYLHRQGREVVAVEPGSGGAQVSARLGVASFRATLNELTLPDNALDAVGMFDVLEHIRDRTALLGEVKRVLKPGGHLVLTLPALRALWSASDVSAGHFLRYSKRSIRRELESAGFTVIRARYFFVLTVVPLFILRALPYRFGRGPAISDEELVAKDIGFIGRIASRVEMLWARVGLVGSSLLVVARSNDSVR